VGLAGSFWAAVVLLLALSAAEGVAMPVQQAYLHEVVPSAQRATVVSSVSLVSSAGGVGGQLGLGWIARAQSLGAGYLAGGLALLLALPPLLLLRRMGGRADVIVGRRAGTKGPCAAQGLPVVASVDTLPRHPTAAATNPLQPEYGAMRRDRDRPPVVPNPRLGCEHEHGGGTAMVEEGPR
jgi:MFS family permease